MSTMTMLTEPGRPPSGQGSHLGVRVKRKAELHVPKTSGAQSEEAEQSLQAQDA